MLKIWQGLRFFRKSAPGYYSIVSYHHPDSITWRLHLSLDTRNKKYYLKFGPQYSWGTKYFAPNGDFGAWATLPFIGTFSFDKQSHMWRK